MSIANHVETALLLSLPLVVSGVLHMAVVRADLFPALRVPIARSAFGENKTWRGLVVVPLTTILGVHLARAVAPIVAPHALVDLRHANAAVVGLVLGLGYVLAELPNSYLKRRRGIAPGELPAENALWFAFWDQADSALGCAIASTLVLDVPLATLVAIVVLGPAIHLVANLSLYSAGLRRRPL